MGLYIAVIEGFQKNALQGIAKDIKKLEKSNLKPLELIRYIITQSGYEEQANEIYNPLDYLSQQRNSIAHNSGRTDLQDHISSWIEDADKMLSDVIKAIELLVDIMPKIQKHHDSL